MLLDRKSLAVRAFASKDETRPTLTGVLVRTDGTTVATNGYALAMCAPDPEAPRTEEYPHEPNGNAPGETPVAENFVLPVDAANAVAKALPKKTTLPVLAYACVDGKATNANGSARILTTDLDSWHEVNAEKIDGTYPKYEQVIPKGKPSIRIGFNAVLLAQMLKVANEIGDNPLSHQVTLEIYSPVTAMKITAGRFTGLIMPLSLVEG